MTTRDTDGASERIPGNSRWPRNASSPRASRSTAGYFRRWFGNFLVTDDQSHVASDYDQYSITPGLIPPAPVFAGGATLPAQYLHHRLLQPETGDGALRRNNIVGLSDTFFPGSNMIDHWNGFDLSLDMRLPRGIIFPRRHEHRSAGDRHVRHRGSGQCGPVRRPVAACRDSWLRRASRVSSCHVEQNWLTQIKFQGSYTVPKIDVSIGAGYSEHPGNRTGARRTPTSTATWPGRSPRAGLADCRSAPFPRPPRPPLSLVATADRLLHAPEPA